MNERLVKIAVTQVPKTPCRCCGRKLDAASCGEYTPQPGDLSLCIYCGELSKFDDNMCLVPLEEEELLELDLVQITTMQRIRKNYLKVLKGVGVVKDDDNG